MSREKVLIVEDEQNERTGLAELVSSWGYVAETARDGQEGYEKVGVWSRIGSTAHGTKVSLSSPNCCISQSL